MRMSCYIEPCLSSAWQKIGVALEPQDRSEYGSIQNFKCAAEPLDERRWRLWYSVNSARGMMIAVAEGAPGEPTVHHHAILSEGKLQEALLHIPMANRAP